MQLVAIVAIALSWLLAALAIVFALRMRRDVQRLRAEKEQLRKLHQDYMAGPAVLS
ncbi:MAG: sensor histidine kinase, partial [Trueperella pyogenes]|nr:sensor histidine kinase [Trueperella pyogenes]